MEMEKLLDEYKALFDEKRYPEAIDACNEILKRDLNNQSALGNKARSLYLLDRHEDALELLENALIIYPNNDYFWFIKLDVLMAMEEYGKAIVCFEKIFEIGVDDESAFGFFKGEYETCLSLRVDQLIEMEKYVDAWKCYNQKLKVKSFDMERSKAIRSFKRYVSNYTSQVKKRHYYVRISSNEAKSGLMGFLEENGFEVEYESGLLVMIDVVEKTCCAVSVDEVGHERIISESKFYDKINYYPRDRIVRKKIFDEYGNLMYEGYTLHNAPYGFGIAYFANGNVYRDGIFDIKGIVQGKEYYPSGQLRFEGEWSLTRGYGPNAPYDGNAYDEDGNLIYSGKFEIKRGGVGWPMIRNPKGFPAEQKQRPKIDYY